MRVQRRDLTPQLRPVPSPWTAYSDPVTMKEVTQQCSEVREFQVPAYWLVSAATNLWMRDNESYQTMLRCMRLLRNASFSQALFYRISAPLLHDIWNKRPLPQEIRCSGRNRRLHHLCLLRNYDIPLRHFRYISVAREISFFPPNSQSSIAKTKKLSTRWRAGIKNDCTVLPLLMSINAFIYCNFLESDRSIGPRFNH